MWRSFFLALGIFLMILGGQSLIVDHVVLANSRRVPTIVTGQNANGSVGYRNSPSFSNGSYRNYQSPFQNVGYANSSPQMNARVIRTKEWMPWSLLATGAIIVMYTLSLPPRGSSSSYSNSEE